MSAPAKRAAAALAVLLAAACGSDTGTTTTVTSPSGPPTTASLAGVVTSSTGTPIAGARVSIQPNPNTLNPSVFTDSQGAYRFDALPAGDTQVHAEAARFDEASGRVVVDGKNRLNFVLHALATFTLRGVVQDADTGAPIAGATVTFLVTPGATVNPARSATTDDRGEYRFDGVYPANSNFSATAPGYQEWRTGLRVTEGAPLNFPLRRVPEPQAFSGSVGATAAQDFPFTMRRPGSADVTLTWEPPTASAPRLQLQIVPLSGPLTPVPSTPATSTNRIDVSYPYIWAGQYALRVVNPAGGAGAPTPFSLTFVQHD